MNSIFKAMVYRIIKGRVFVYTLVWSIVFPIVLSFVGLLSDNEQGIYGTWDNFFFIGNLIYFVFVCAYNCADYKNKTINFEVMNGHSPMEIFIGRLSALVLFVLIMFNIGFVILHCILMNSPIYVNFMQNDGLNIGKILAIELVVLSYVVFYVVLSFVIRNMLASLLASWMGFAFSGLVVILDNQEMMSTIKKISSIIGPYTVKWIVLEDFSYRQGIVSVICSLTLISLFLFAGSMNIFKQEF